MSGGTSTGDVLTASSVLAALVTFLYANAFTTITNALEIQRGERKAADLRAESCEVKRAIRPALAVCAAAIVLAAIFTPKVVDLVRDGHVFGQYDPIALSLLVVCATFVIVALHSAHSVRLLAKKRAQLERD